MYEPIIVTHSGKYVNLLEPDPDTICIKDIAHHLARLCRFTGATNEFYSVAQHCVFVSEIIAAPYAMEGLMHDATETYLGDVSSPLKSALPEYKAIEMNFQAVIAEKFGLDFHQEAIKQADAIAYVAERNALIQAPFENDPCVSHFEGLPILMSDSPWTAEDAEGIFLARFEELDNIETVNA